ncbi:MAG TPA: ribbon-helix-helix protein, CopG family [Candidatus Saccharimonadales bacterium]|nr:ribbon-helix-helix protein, CopG family [Candidatus Saccharimonadales bacterium]
MFSERLQVLLSPVQRRRLEREAKRRGMSVGALIREAIDARVHTVPAAGRREAVDAIRAFSAGRFVPPEELEQIVGAERETQVGLARARARR